MCTSTSSRIAAPFPTTDAVSERNLDRVHNTLLQFRPAGCPRHTLNAMQPAACRAARQPSQQKTHTRIATENVSCSPPPPILNFRLAPRPPQYKVGNPRFMGQQHYFSQSTTQSSTLKNGEAGVMKKLKFGFEGGCLPAKMGSHTTTPRYNSGRQHAPDTPWAGCSLLLSDPRSSQVNSRRGHNGARTS